MKALHLLGTARRSARRGGAAVEAALVFPFLFLLLFGIMESSWMFLQKSSMDVALREGLREGITQSTATCEDVAEARAREVLAEFALDGTGDRVIASRVGTPPTETLTLNISVPYAPLTGIQLIPNLTATGNMLLELQDD